MLQYDAYGDDPFWPPENITIGYMIARPKEVDRRKYPDNPLRVRLTGIPCKSTKMTMNGIFS